VALSYELGFIEKTVIGTNHLKLNLGANILLILGYSLLFVVSWIQLSSGGIQLEMHVLNTIIQPSDKSLWTANILGSECTTEFGKEGQLCWNIHRINACFIVFMICKAISLMFNIVSIHAGMKVVSKTK
jgi:hypothetical protein